jgi:ABC-type phosphate transport system substrate-binding protein
MVLACGACSFLLDRSASQCKVDADCARFAFLPYCVSGACEPSGLGPAPDCFVGTPVTPAQFHNQCSTGFLPPGPSGGACLSFDDCAHLGVCDGSVPPLVPPPVTPTASDGGSPPSQLPSNSGLPSCADQATKGGIVYITGSSNFPGVLQRMAPTILKGTGNTNPGPMPIFMTTSSCTATKAIFTGNTTLKDPPAGSPDSKYAQYFDTNGGMFKCSLGVDGIAFNIGESDVYSTTCDPSLQPSAPASMVVEAQGPNQAMAFVVPSTSSQQAISHEAAREVFGLGGNGGQAAPWTNPENYFVRNKNTGTQQMIGLAIGVDAGAFWGVDQGSADGVRVGVEGNTMPPTNEQTIGIISVDVYDENRGNVKVLAYKESDQECAYLPDSTAASKDKRNVRDGHYPIWGPLHFFRPNPDPSPYTVRVVPFFDGSNQTQDVIDSLALASLVPRCAMSVQREGVELGALASYTPQLSCACYYESKTGSPGQTPSPGCTTCSGSDDCPANRTCSLGFCELASP